MDLLKGGSGQFTAALKAFGCPGMFRLVAFGGLHI
jgi:hypothetical protein